MNTFFLTVVNMSLTGSIVILTVLFIRLLLKRTPKIFSYILWIVVLFRLVCPVVPSTSWGLPQARGGSQSTLLQSSFQKVENMESANAPEGSTDIVAENQQTQNKDNSISNVNQNNGTHKIQNRSIWHRMFIVTEYIWLLGILILLLYSLDSYRNLKEGLKEARLVDSNIYELEKLQTPFVFGFLKPCIYLPTGVTGEEREYILAHERMHIRRLDYIVKLIGFLVVILHWMNPLVWVAFLCMTRDMEMSCDEAVIRSFGMEIKKEYSTSLLHMAMSQRGLDMAPLAFGEGNVKSRIKNVLKYKKTGIGILVICVCILIFAIMILTTNRITPENQIRLSRVHETEVNDSSILQEYKLNADAKSYMLFSVSFSDGQETERNVIASGNITDENRNGERQISFQYGKEENSSLTITVADNFNSQAMTYPLGAYTLHAGNAMWEKETSYHDIVTNTAYLLTTEYIGSEKTTSMQAFACEDLVKDETAWDSAMEQSSDSGITMFMVYYVIFDKSIEDLSIEPESLPLHVRTYPSNLEQMYSWRREYIGDNSAVGNITDAWFINEAMPLQKAGFELQTDTEPYEVTVRYLSEESAYNAYYGNGAELERNAALFFSLVHNAGIINISINNQTMISFTRTEMEQRLGDLWTMGETYEEFCRLYNLITDSQNRKASGEDPDLLDRVMSRLVETIGTERALPYNKAAAITPNQDALIKLCTSQDGKYEAYGCVSPEFGFQGIILNDIIDGEANHNYLYEAWNYSEKQPELVTLDEAQYNIAFFSPEYVNGILTTQIRYFTGHDTGTLTEEDKPEILLDEAAIFSISVTKDATGKELRYSRLDSNTAFLQLLEKYEGLMITASQDRENSISAYPYAFRIYDNNNSLLQTLYLSGSEIDIAGDMRYEEAGLGSIKALYLAADSLF